MTFQKFVTVGGEIFARARKVELYFAKLAEAARFAGCEEEAQKLEKIGARAAPLAQFLVMQLKERS